MGNTEEIVVGAEDGVCSVQEVIKQIKKCESFHLFYDKWRSFAVELDIDQTIVNFIEKKLANDLNYDFVRYIITVWSADKGKKATLALLNQALRNTGLTTFAEILERHFVKVADAVSEQVVSNRTNIKFNVWDPVENFTGRGQELTDLSHKIFEKPRGKNNIPNIVCISALGGIGKTQLVRKYVQENESEFDGNCIWMDALTKEKLIDSFKDFVKTFKLQSPANIPELIKEVYNFFQSSKTLFVFDDAEKEPWLVEFFPEENPNFTILLTSREQKWNHEVKTFALKELKVDDAIEFIKGEFEKNKIKVSKEEEEDFCKLARRLQCYPLALQQAIAYLLEQRDTCAYSIKNYLEEFEQKQKKLLSVNVNNYLDKLYKDDDYLKTTFTTWEMTTDKIGMKPDVGKLAIWILNVSAYLDPVRIQRDLFYKLAPNTEIYEIELDPNSEEIGVDPSSYFFNSEGIFIPPEKVVAAVKLLVNYSMINSVDHQSILNIHRLVQDVTRIKLRLSRGERCNIFKEVLNILNNDNFSGNVSHTLTAWRYGMKQNYFEILKSFVTQIPSFMVKLEEDGYPKSALEIGENALKVLKETCANRNDSYFTIQSLLATILAAVGENIAALEKAEEIYAKAISVFVGNDQRLFAIKECLAATLQRSGRLDEAEIHFLSVYENNVNNLGLKHIESLNAHQNYVVLLTDAGKFNKALEIFPKLITSYKESGGVNNPELYRTNNNFAYVYYKVGNYHQALEILQDVYQKINSDDDFIFFTNVCYNYVKLLTKDKQFDKAHSILEANYEKIKQSLGEDHVSTVKLLQMKGTVLRMIGDFESAIDDHNTAYKYFMQLFGEDNVDTQLAKRELAQDCLQAN